MVNSIKISIFTMLVLILSACENGSHRDWGDRPQVSEDTQTYNHKFDKWTFVEETQMSYIYRIKMENGDICYITDNKRWTNSPSAISCVAHESINKEKK